MKAFTFETPRSKMVKVLFGLGAIAFLVRGVMGMGDRAVLLGVTVDGYERFVYVALAAAAVLLLWDIRDKVVGD